MSETIIVDYFKNAFGATLQSKTIPSLDGLRAISVGFVVLSHILFKNFDTSIYRFFIYQEVGVSLFFVISGYLITTILIKEQKAQGGIDYKKFALKRVFRIFPAYYFFLVFWMILGPYFGYEIDGAYMLASFLYVGAYYPAPISILFGHSWSLAVEEQFYLFWPLVLKLFSDHNKIIRLILILILLMPFSRVLTYYFSDLYKYKYYFLIHGRLDTLMFGCLLAFATEYKRFSKYIEFLKQRRSFYLSLIFLLALYPVLNFYFLAKYKATLGYTIEGICLISVIVHLRETQNNWYFRFLNSNILKHIGGLSYGIYLWQQPFTSLSGNFLFSFPLNLLMIYLAALMSYFVIEFPFMLLRRKVL